MQNGLEEQAVKVLVEAAELIGQSLDPTTAIEGILSLLSEKLLLNHGRVLLPKTDSSELIIRYSCGLTASEQDRGIYALGEGVTGKVMSSGHIALIPNVNLEPTYLARVSAATHIQNNPLAYIAVPITQEDTTIGVLAVHPDNDDQTKLTSHLFVLQIMAQMICQILRINNLVKEKTKTLINENKKLRSMHTHDPVTMEMQGKSPAFIKAIEKATLSAKSEAAVFLHGESGSGKEKFARMIHQQSDRRDKPFICINCAAIPHNLLESELFGHEKGSYTGATTNRIGKFELAKGGTVFLDEIGDMPFDLQSKLLRVLQEKVIQRVGASKDLPIDVRIISATNVNLEEAVNRSEFRLDLFYRLNVVRINLPPLRARKEDIRLLALHFLSRENQRYTRNVILTEDAMDLLEHYEWPGNIRQLENVIERAVIFNHQDKISVEYLRNILKEEASISLNVNSAPKLKQTQSPSSISFDDTIRGYARVIEDDRPKIIEAIHKTRGNKTAAARILGMTPRQLHYRINKLEIETRN